MTCTPRHPGSGLCPDCGYDVLTVRQVVPDPETLRRIGEGIMERMPGIVRVRAGAAVWQHLYDDLKACEYEYDSIDESGQAVKAVMCFRWSKPGLDRPNLLVYGKPVELDDALVADALAFDGRESM